MDTCLELIQFGMGNALLTFQDGSIGHVISNFSSVTPHSHKISIYGTKGTFHHGPLGCCYFWNRDKDSQPEMINDAYPGTHKGDIIPSFVDHILDEGKEPSVTRHACVKRRGSYLHSLLTDW